MFLKNCWYVAAWDYELIDRKLLARFSRARATLSGDMARSRSTIAARIAALCSPKGGAGDGVHACAIA
jgi:hypothetical protein